MSMKKKKIILKHLFDNKKNFGETNLALPQVMFGKMIQEDYLSVFLDTSLFQKCLRVRKMCLK